MEKSNRQTIAGKAAASYGYSAFHEIIYSALLRQLDKYDSVWSYATHQSQVAELAAGRLSALIVTVEEARIPVILLTHALVEALANWYLAMKSDGNSIKNLERRPLIQKWTEVPRQWAPNYSLPNDDDLCKDLKQLIARRKSITHHQPEISVNGTKIHEGSRLKLSLNQHNFIKSCGTLPQRLVDHLQTFDSAGYVRILSEMFRVKRQVLSNGTNLENVN